MKARQAFSILISVATGATLAINADIARAGNFSGDKELQLAARLAVSPDPAQSARAIEKLRAAGPAGLDAILETHARLISQHTTGTPLTGLGRNDPDWHRLCAAIDEVGQQRDCQASHLFWFTNFDQAKAAARAAGKPILSLRLLGNLDEEYSCANSRFFRTTLYSNTEVSQFLRDHFILHWQSVRPVPRITIEFGDGRRIERTITGNSIHYVLDSDGRPIDALPGLYGPKAFIAGLTRALGAVEELEPLDGRTREPRLRAYHQKRLQAVEREWRDDLQKVGQFPSSAPLLRTLAAGSSPRPAATVAAPRAISKTVVEAPMLRQIQPGQGSERGSLRNAADGAAWQRIAALHEQDAALDANSRRLIRDKAVSAADAARRALSKRKVEDPMLSMIQNLQRSVAEDTVRNEYLLHSKIHEWFATGAAPTDLNELNTKVYAELFLTPNSDPWLGLAPADAFSALDNGGLIQTDTRN